MNSNKLICYSIHILNWQVLVILIALLASSCASSEESDEAEESFYYGVASDVDGGVQGYTEEEIGVRYMVDEYISHRFGSILTRYRSYEEAMEADEAAIYNKTDEPLSVEARDRDFFEQTIQFVFLAASEAMPAEVSKAVDKLYDAFFDSLDLCAENSAWPDIQLYYYENEGYYSPGPDQFNHAVQKYGVTLRDFEDLEHMCHKFAATYPSLTSQRRDELVNIRRDYFLEVLRLWMQDHPEMVVPMTYEQSINHPYQDYIREICRAAENPEECARSEGITLE
ncbi:MAG: hypothetical protein OXE79_02610 [Acidimicrobiaceae bacterium]|nr:hypothetical protein [Acidimicrobiaceae bacterium]